MKTLFKLVLVGLIFVVNLAIAQPSFADPPKVTKTPDYIQVNKTLNGLLALQETEEVTPEVQQRIDELTLQKALIESGVTWGQCRNETGNTIGIFGPPASEKASENSLYYLADGETTPEGWDCQGIYLPSGTEAAGIKSTPAVFKILDGTRLVARRNADTSAIEFNIPPMASSSQDSKVTIPNISQTFIESRIPSTFTAMEIED